MAIEVKTPSKIIWKPDGIKIPIKVEKEKVEKKTSHMRLRSLSLDKNKTSQEYSARDGSVFFRAFPLKPGEYQFEVEELVIGSFQENIEGIQQITINILTPFFHWQKYWETSSADVPENELPIYFPGGLTREIKKFLESSNQNILWLSGPPASGKSYLIEHYIRGKCKENVVLVKLESSSRRELRQQLSGNDTIAECILPKHQPMRAIMNTINQDPVIIIVDGSYAADHIIEDIILEMLLYQKEYERQREVAQNMSESFSKTRKFIVTGICDHKGILPGEENIPKIDPYLIEMGFWTQTDIRKYIEENTGGWDIDIEEIYHQTGGHPYLVNAYCDLKLRMEPENYQEKYQEKVQELYEKYRRVSYLTQDDSDSIKAFQGDSEKDGWFDCSDPQDKEQWDRLEAHGILICNEGNQLYKMVEPFGKVKLL